MDPLIEVRNLKTHFFTEDGVVRAVDDVSFHIAPGEVLGLVGESGCGKSVASLSVMRLVSPPGRIVAGEIIFKGVDLVKLPEREMRAIRGNEISMIFQEPMTSLNPVFTVGDQVAEAIQLHSKKSRQEALKEAVRLLDAVRIHDPQKRIGDYPHQLSGGMRQRVMIAMALSCNPSLLIADEPSTALDVTIQAQILDILLRLRQEYGLAVLLITHDLGVIAETADRVAVMYTGKIVEEAPIHELFKQPRHPYTQGLLRSVPNVQVVATKGRQRLHTITGNVPDLLDLPVGCAFQARCPEVHERCREAVPELVAVAGDHTARCVLYGPGVAHV